GTAEASFVEVKNIGASTRVRKDLLEDALLQAAGYVLESCMLQKTPGTYVRNIAAVALPSMASLLGRVMVKLDARGNVIDGWIELGQLQVWSSLHDNSHVSFSTRVKADYAEDSAFEKAKKKGETDEAAKEAGEAAAWRVLDKAVATNKPDDPYVSSAVFFDAGQMLWDLANHVGKDIVKINPK
ncbi:MAG: uncharacterized protein A8A55_3456, partial [Amphiamblys sp. WSBS2006]